MDHIIKKQSASSSPAKVRSYFAEHAGWSTSVIGRAVSHLSRTISYQGRMDLHRALNG